MDNQTISQQIEALVTGTVSASSSNFTQGRTTDIKYIVIHYTANDGDKAISNCNYFKSGSRGSSAHYFIDENYIYRSVLDLDTAWHCGASSYKHTSCRNNNSIGIEMCSRKDSSNKYYIKDEVVSKTLTLTHYLMQKYNIPIENVLRHYDVTGKICPAPFVENTQLWTNFKSNLTDFIKQEELEISKELEDNNSFEEVSYMKVNRKYIFDNTTKEFEVINADGSNYIKVTDIALLLNKEVSYDSLTKITTIK